MSGDGEQQSFQESDDEILKSWKILAANRRFIPFDLDSEKNWNGPFYFIQGADIQFGLIKRYIQKNPVPDWFEEIQLAEKAVERINNLVPRPKFFIICGDLLDMVPSDSPEIYRLQELSFKEIFRKINPDIPLVCVCGNHDVGDRPTPENIQSYRTRFGDDFFSFWCGGVYFIVINSQYYFDTSAAQEFADEHHEWLDSQLDHVKSGNAKHVVVFQHIPWFLNEANEPEGGYFAVAKEIRLVMLDKLLKAGVKYVFCGHYHRNAGGFYKDLEVVVTSAIGGQLGSDKSGMRVVKVFEDKIEHAYHDLDNFPSHVKC